MLSALVPNPHHECLREHMVEREGGRYFCFCTACKSQMHGSLLQSGVTIAKHQRVPRCRTVCLMCLSKQKECYVGLVKCVYCLVFYLLVLLVASKGKMLVRAPSRANCFKISSGPSSLVPDKRYVPGILASAKRMRQTLIISPSHPLIFKAWRDSFQYQPPQIFTISRFKRVYYIVYSI